MVPDGSKCFSLTIVIDASCVDFLQDAAFIFVIKSNLPLESLLVIS